MLMLSFSKETTEGENYLPLSYTKSILTLYYSLIYWIQ